VARRWAAEQLGVEPDAAPAEARAAFLRLLDETELMPPAGCRRAWRVLNGSAAAPPEAVRDAEERCRADVDAFADCFWALPPADRRREWEALSARCAAVPAARTRLRQLEAGLSVRPTDAGPEVPLLAELAAAVRELFVLGPVERAGQRQELLRRIPEQPRPWHDAARALRRGQPEVAALLPELLDEVEKWQERQEDRGRKLIALSRAVVAAPPPRARTGNEARFVWVAVVVVGMVVHLALMHAPTAAPPPTHSLPDVKIPDFRRLQVPEVPPFPGDAPLPPLDDPEMERLRQQVDKSLRSTQPIPGEALKRILEAGERTAPTATGKGSP
jgi:hypothetical protein